MDMTIIFYAYDERGRNVWTGRALDVLGARKEAAMATGLTADQLSVERA